MLCNSCGFENDAAAGNCAKCGAQLAGVTGDAAIGGIDVEYLATAIGPKKTEFYLQHFRQFASGDGSLSWNWPAFFLTLPWLLYRKMWLYALGYILVGFVIVGALEYVFAALGQPDLGSGLGTLAQLGIGFIAAPALANVLYYKTVQTRIAAARARDEDREEQLRTLASRGGTSHIALPLLVTLVPAIGIIGAVAIPAYQDYTIRAQVVQGLVLAAEPRSAIEDYVFTNGQAPIDRAEAGMSRDPRDSSGSFVEAVAIENGRIDIYYGRQANALISGRILSITPYAVDQGNDEVALYWRCGLAPVPAGSVVEIAVYSPGTLAAEQPRYVPSGCRPQ